MTQYDIGTQWNNLIYDGWSRTTYARFIIIILFLFCSALMLRDTLNPG